MLSLFFADQHQSTLRTYFRLISGTRLKKQNSNKKQITANPNPIARIKKALVKSNKRIATWRAEFFGRLLAKHSAALRWPKILSTQKCVRPVSHISMSLKTMKCAKKRTDFSKENKLFHITESLVIIIAYRLIRNTWQDLYIRTLDWKHLGSDCLSS